jgi:hypothetical protein
MNYEKFFQKLKVEVDDQKMPMHKLFIAKNNVTCEDVLALEAVS